MLTYNKIPHNKKRNVGLVFEFFSRYIAKAMLESRQQDVDKAKTLIRKHFNKSTDLYKELKMFKALKDTKVNNRDSAERLIAKVKTLAENQSQARLDLEKTSLIHEINQVLNDPSFFNQSIDEYKVMGAIQILLNSWRSKDLNESIGTMFQFEEIVIDQMLLEESKVVEEPMADEDTSHLVINIMIKKINDQFGSLNEEQRKIISLYVLQEQNEVAKKELTSIFENLKQEIAYLSENNDEFKNKLVELNEMANNEYQDISNVNDDTVTFFLGVSQINKELRNG